MKATLNNSQLEKYSGLSIEEMQAKINNLKTVLIDGYLFSRKFEAVKKVIERKNSVEIYYTPLNNHLFTVWNNEFKEIIKYSDFETLINAYSVHVLKGSRREKFHTAAKLNYYESIFREFKSRN